MKLISSKPLPKGGTRITIELDPGEKWFSFHPQSYYKLGYPHDIIVPGHILDATGQVMWDDLEQKWVEP